MNDIADTTFRIPERGEVWLHNKKQKAYIIINILNEGNSTGDDNNPPIIEYMDGEGRKFAREYLKWHESFTFRSRL